MKSPVYACTMPNQIPRKASSHFAAGQTNVCLSQSGRAVVFSMSKLQLKEIGSEPGIQSTGCLWVVLPILFSCCVCLCLHFRKLNDLVCSQTSFHVSAGLPYKILKSDMHNYTNVIQNQLCTHSKQRHFLGSHLRSPPPILNYGTIVLLCLSISNATLCCICCSTDMEEYRRIWKLFTWPLKRRLYVWVIVGQAINFKARSAFSHGFCVIEGVVYT